MVGTVPFRTIGSSRRDLLTWHACTYLRYEASRFPIGCCRCEQCQYQTNRHDLLTRHAKTHEAAAQPCGECDFASSRLDVLNKHRKTVHEGVRQGHHTTSPLYFILFFWGIFCIFFSNFLIENTVPMYLPCGYGTYLRTAPTLLTIGMYRYRKTIVRE